MVLLLVAQGLVGVGSSPFRSSESDVLGFVFDCGFALVCDSWLVCIVIRYFGRCVYFAWMFR